MVIELRPAGVNISLGPVPVSSARFGYAVFECVSTDALEAPVLLLPSYGGTAANAPLATATEVTTCGSMRINWARDWSTGNCENAQFLFGGALTKKLNLLD